MWQEGWRGSAGGGRGARGHGGRGEFSQSLTPAGWSVGGWGQLACMFFHDHVVVVVVFLADEADVAALCAFIQLEEASAAEQR